MQFIQEICKVSGFNSEFLKLANPLTKKEISLKATLLKTKFLKGKN